MMQWRKQRTGGMAMSELASLVVFCLLAVVILGTAL